MQSSPDVKVAKIIEDGYQLVLNKGTEQGVAKGDKFLIYELGEDIIDPDSGESLGPLELVKGTGTVIHVQSNVSIIKSNETDIETETSTPGLMTGVARLMQDKKERKRRFIIPFENPNVGDIAKKIK